MFDGRLKVTICGAKDLQHTKLTERFDEWQLTKAKTKEVTSLEPYVAIDVDEVAVERTSTKQKTKARKEDGGRRPAVAHPVLCAIHISSINCAICIICHLTGTTPISTITKESFNPTCLVHICFILSMICHSLT